MGLLHPTDSRKAVTAYECEAGLYNYCVGFLLSNFCLTICSACRGLPINDGDSVVRTTFLSIRRSIHLDPQIRCSSSQVS